MSIVQICNRALSTYLGQGHINSLTESTPMAEQCNLHYSDTLQSLTEAHWWIHATGRQVMAELTNDRTTEWAYNYQRPADALVIRWVNDAASARLLLSQDQDPDTPRDTTGLSIYSDVSVATCEFTKSVTDTSLFPQYFSDALSAMLAANMAMPLAENLRAAQNAMSQAENKLDQAMALDEAQLPPSGYQSMPSYLSQRGIS